MGLHIDEIKLQNDRKKNKSGEFQKKILKFLRSNYINIIKTPLAIT